MTGPSSTAADSSALGREGLLDLLGSLEFDDPILSSLLLPARDRQGTKSPREALDSAQVPDLAALGSSAVPQVCAPRLREECTASAVERSLATAEGVSIRVDVHNTVQEGPPAASSPLHVKHGAVTPVALPATPLCGSPFDQQAVQANASHAPAQDPCVPPLASSGQPFGDFLLDAAVLAAPLERDGSALLQGILAPDFSRQFEAAAAASAGGAGTLR